jgi:transposase
MRRKDDRQPDAMFSYVSAELRVPKDHPLRAIPPTRRRRAARNVSGTRRPLCHGGPPLGAAGAALRAQLLQIFHSIRRERLSMEQLDYNLLVRWFVGLEMDEPIWTPTVFTKNRDRLLNQDVARSFFRRVVERAAGPAVR